MSKESKNRAELIKVILASGLTLVGLATGNGPFFALLLTTSVNVGGNLLSNVTDRAIDNWRNRWFTPEGILRNPIKQALSRAFADSVRQLEIDWKKNNNYHYLVYKQEYDRARLSLTLLSELREDADKLFQDDGIIASLNPENMVTMVGQNKLGESAAYALLDAALDKYLGAIEPLANFAKLNLGEKWILRFDEILKSDDGTPAWRACQELWQSCLLNAIALLQQSTDETNSDVLELRQSLAQVTDWLDHWGDQLTTLGETNRNSIGAEVFAKLSEQRLEAFQSKLEGLKSDTELIINLLNNKFSQLDPEKVMTNFLQKELLNDQYVNLKQAGHTIDYEDVTLAKVFVDLPVSDSRQIDPADEEAGKDLPPGIVAKILDVASEHLDSQSLTMDNDLDQDELLRSSTMRRRGRFVIIGGPGQGKSTVGQFFCQIFRATILEKRPDVLYEKVRHTLSEIKSLCHQERIELSSLPRFPFRIVLNEFAARLASDKSINSLISYIVDRIRTRTNQEITAEHLRIWLAQYPWIIILDGLDEVPASSNRKEVLAAVDDFWIDVAGVNGDVLVVATTRPQGYNDEFAPDLYQHEWLTPLSNTRAMHYADSLVKARYSEDKDRQKTIVERLRSALDDQATARLMRSPLQVTIMTDLVDRIGKPPQERWSLFQKYYSVIYQRETERDIPAASILRNYEPDINAIHYRVGLLLQVEAEYSGRTGARLSLERFANLVEARLVEEGHEGKELAELKRQIIEAATDRLVFLVGVEANEIGFEIRSLQEFMAAEALMGASDHILYKRLRKIAPIVNWRSVFLFAAGKCFALEDRQHLRETIRGICSDLNESVIPADEIFRTTLAGSQLALDLLEDGPAQRQPKYAKSLARLACRLWDLAPGRYHLRLADVYHLKLEDVYFQELEKHLQAAPYMGLGAWNSLMRLSEREINWAKLLSERYWPHNQEDLTNLLNVASWHKQLTWIIRNLQSLLESLSPDDISLAFRPVIAEAYSINEPAWLHAFLHPASSSGVNLRLSPQITIDNAFGVRMISEGRGNWMHPFRDLARARSEWLPYIAAANFLEAPSRITLARELRNLAEQSIFVESMAWPVYHLPWVFGSILEDACTKQELESLAIAAEKGQFGDIQDWTLAEKRWSDQGVSVEDLDYMMNTHMPFDKNIGRIGIPLSCLNMGSSFSRNIGYLKPLLALQAKYPSSKLRSQLTCWISFEFMLRQYLGYRSSVLLPSQGNTVETIGPQISTREFRDLIRELDQNNVLLFSDLSMILNPDDPDRDEQIDFLDYVGRERKLHVRFVPDRSESYKALDKAFLDHHERLGILVVLSNYAMSGYRPALPQALLSMERYHDAKYREAALIVRLAQQDWNQSEAKELARDIAVLAKDSPTLAKMVVRVVNAHNMTGPATDSFLIELLGNIPHMDWSTRRQVLDALDNSLGHRTSQLIEFWEELELPSSLKNLIGVRTPTIE